MVRETNCFEKFKSKDPSWYFIQNLLIKFGIWPFRPSSCEITIEITKIHTPAEKVSNNVQLISDDEAKCVERCHTDYHHLVTSGHNRNVLVKTIEECRQHCEDRGDYAYGLECPITHESGDFDIECFCFPREAWHLEKNILPLTDCMGQPTDVMNKSIHYNSNNAHCNGPYLQNGKGTGGACRNIIRRTS